MPLRLGSAELYWPGILCYDFAMILILCSDFATAMQFGATEFFNPSLHAEPAQQVLAQMTDGGLDYTFECVGNVKTMVSTHQCQ